MTQISTANSTQQPALASSRPAAIDAPDDPERISAAEADEGEARDGASQASERFFGMLGRQLADQRISASLTLGFVLAPEAGGGDVLSIAGGQTSQNAGDANAQDRQSMGTESADGRAAGAAQDSARSKAVKGEAGSRSDRGTDAAQGEPRDAGEARRSDEPSGSLVARLARQQQLGTRPVEHFGSEVASAAADGSAAAGASAAAKGGTATASSASTPVAAAPLGPPTATHGQVQAAQGGRVSAVQAGSGAGGGQGAGGQGAGSSAGSPASGAPGGAWSALTARDTASARGAGPQAPAHVQTQAQSQAQMQAQLQTKFQAQMERGLTAALKNQNGPVTLRLNPGELGSVRIDLALEGGMVRASFSAEREPAQRLLESNLNSLRAALEARGLAVERLSVEPAGGAPRFGSSPDGDSGTGTEAREHADAGADTDGGSARADEHAAGGRRGAPGEEGVMDDPGGLEPAAGPGGSRAWIETGGAGQVIRIDAVA